MRTLLVAFLIMAMALAGCASETPDDSTEEVQDVVVDLIDAAPEVSAADLLADLASFAPEFNIRADNLPTHEGARQWLADTMEGYGLEVYRQNFTKGIDQANIIGIKWGEMRDKWVVVGGHYDTMTDDCLLGTTTPGAGPVPGVEHGCPSRAASQGAYDDGSGTMMTVHLAKAFANVNTTYSMAFVAYDGEERGTQGAAAFVEAFVTGYMEGNFSSQPYGQIDVVGAVDLDMIGLNWPSVNNPINVLTNSEYLWGETQNITGQLGFPESQIIRKDGLKLGSSDYAQFWRVDEEHGGPIPTIFFIAGFEEVGLPQPVPDQVHTPTSPLPLVPFGAYPFWHLADTMETMSAMAGGEANLEAGFQSATDIAAHLLYKLSIEEGDIDAVVKA